MNYRPDITSYINQGEPLFDDHRPSIHTVLPIHHCLFFVVFEASSLSRTQHHIVVRELHSCPFWASWNCHIILDRRIAIRPYLSDGAVFSDSGEPRNQSLSVVRTVFTFTVSEDDILESLESSFVVTSWLLRRNDSFEIWIIRVLETTEQYRPESRNSVAAGVVRQTGIIFGGKKAAIKRAKQSAIGSACLLFNGYSCVYFEK
jgi:hypothetical protein